MNYEFTVPSKTFLLGEYAVLKGCKGIILTTNPRFKLIAASNQAGVEGINPESPAGKFISLHPDFYQQYGIQFIDPYEQLGGFGASSAQFIMINALKKYVEQRPLDQTEILAEYRACSSKNQYLPPSGADIIAQLHGHICIFHPDAQKIRTYSWVFSDLDYALIHTSQKIKTYHHLQTLKDFDHVEMEHIVQMGVDGLEKKSSSIFSKAINLYAETMQAEGLVAEHTTALLEKLANCSDIQAAKGCGGLGADVIFILFDKNKQNKVISWLKDKNLHVINFGQEVASGLNILRLRSGDKL